jgi:hypothetical protein
MLLYFLKKFITGSLCLKQFLGDPMRFNSSVGFILLAIYLIAVGLTYFGIAIPAIILGLLALISGILILIGR